MSIANAIHQCGSEVRDVADELFDHDHVTREQYEQIKAAVALVGVLRKMTGESPAEHVRRMFGAPGDWGYETPIGIALARIYEAPS